MARFPRELFETGRVAVVAGSTTGSPDAMEEFWCEYLREKSIRHVSSTSFLRVMSHTVASHLALVMGLPGRSSRRGAPAPSATRRSGWASI